MSDGVSTLPLEVVPNADSDIAMKLADAAFLPSGKDLPIAINTYLVRSGNRLALVDTGGGKFFGPLAGVRQQNLRAVGITPEQVDVLVLTHLHPDHVAGMVTDDGRATFPKATLMVHEAELAYWNDDARLTKAPAVQRPWFMMARNAIAPYAKRTERFTQNGEMILPGMTVEELPRMHNEFV